MKSLYFAFILFLSGFVIKAQPLQSPAEFLGYPLGSQFTFHHQVTDYFKAIARQSPKVKLLEYGTTNEHRPLIATIITSEENMKNIEQIRKNNLINAGLLDGNKQGKELPIVWLSYNIHGDEAASTEAAMKTLYFLISGKDPEAEKWLNELVIVIDPCMNPDGRDRYVNWYRQTASQDPNVHTESAEHHQPWPGGRFNHYLFDLNRDWVWQTQKESTLRTALYRQWMPHIHVDFHEMRKHHPYYFAPAAKPFHEDITDWQSRFQEHAGKNHAKYFDKKGWLYFTKEVYDLFYPGYGDTWPSFQGAVGFTYEQGGGGQAGLRILTTDKDTITLTDRLEHHFTTGISTIETAYNHRKQLLEEFSKYFSEAGKNGYGPYKTYIIKNTGHPERIEALLKLLDQNQIKYAYAKPKKKSYKAFTYTGNKEQMIEISEKDIAISAYQPLSVLLKVLMEPRSLLEDSLTYDVTAWALPYIYNVEAYALKERIEVGEQPDPAFTPNEIPGKLPYAYLVSWNNFNNVRLLAALLKNDIQVRVAEKPFIVEGKDFNAGALIITRIENKHLGDQFDQLVVKIANQLQQPLMHAYTGMVSEGVDLGSGKIQQIDHAPRVALIGGKGISPTAFGPLWFYFEQELNYPVTVLKTDYFSSVDLGKFDVVILPGGSSDIKEKDKILSYVQKGGKVIAIEDAMEIFAKDSTTVLAKSIQRKKDEKGNEKEKVEETDLLKKYGNRQRDELSKNVPGSIYKVYLDNTHPLAFGESGHTFLVKQNDKAYPYLGKGGWNVGIFKEDSHISGFTGSKIRKKIPGTLAFGVENHGKGKIIYFPDSPVFRSFWYNGKLLLGNALFLVN